jgi:cell wall-associated NlpC family hydrolase
MRLLFLILAFVPALAFAFFPDGDIATFQKQIAAMPVGERIAFWAEKFIGTPYDTDPLGEYVRRKVIVADERVDCMYLTFRAVELAMGRAPGDAQEVALSKRFMHRGKMERGNVLNYDDRFQYGEDMLESGKWGAEVTSELGRIRTITTQAGKEVSFVPASAVVKRNDLFRSGDIVFFVNTPDRMAGGIVIGHIGILDKEKGGVYLIHASGRKGRGGKVKKVSFPDYLRTMPFAGIRVSRFDSVAQ